ncbi:MAG TPA: di-heme oxidoredictase family protein [Chitinophagales bacterium]|nr:di-heme oxidoredictase family protein [Chitinophagales bacterium]
MKNQLLLIIAVLFSAVTFTTSCQKMMPAGPLDENVLEGTIPGLTPEEENKHLIGDEAFGKIFSEEEGLGPIFVQTSCSNCHIGDGKGHPSNIVTRFANVTGAVTDYLIEKGGPQLQNHSVGTYPAETLPSEANVFSNRMAPAVMGLGYVAALDDQSILANADPDDADGDGISGRPNYVDASSFFVPENINIPNNGKYIGRFGKKARQVTIQDMAVFALKEDIGITSDFDKEDVYNCNAGMNIGDNVPDPEVSADFVNDLVFYVRTLQAPPRRNTDDPDVLEGEKLFTQIGCTGCHKPTFTTAQSDIAALSYQTFHPYSDFLLHDMGPALDDGYPEGGANSYEWRTPPLWGIGLASDSQGGQMFLLHDGRASTFEDAVSNHGGEAAGRRTAFFSLSPEQRQQIIKFLESL